MLDDLREAGRIASAARGLGAARVVAGASLLEVCQAVEDEIHRRGGALAFPVQTSRTAAPATISDSPSRRASAAMRPAARRASMDIG